MDSNFFKQLFTSLTSEDSWTVLGMLLISFLIGLITNYFLNRRRVKDLELELEKSARDNAHVKSLMTKLEEQHALQGADLKKASLELVDKSKTLEIAEAEKRTLNSRLNATLVDLDKSKEEFQESTNRLEDLNDQILGLRTKNSQLSTELEQSNTVNTQYSLTQGTGVEDPETKQQIANLMAENSLLKGSIDELKSGTSPEGTAAASIRITELEAENEALKSNVTINNPIATTGIISGGNESSETYAAMEAKVAELEAEKEKLEDSLAEVTQLEDGNEALNVTVRSLMEENEELKDKLDELPQLEGGNEALNSTIKTLIEENEELKDKLDELPQYESGNEVLTSSMNTLVGENEDLQGDAEKLIQYEAGNEILNKTITDLISKNEALEEELSNTANSSNNSNSPLEWSVGANGTQEIVEEEEEVSPEEAQSKFRAAIGTQIAMASKDERDDLKQINGIGPFIEEKLNDLGIYTFEQVSQLDEDLIVTLTSAIEFFPGRIERDEWVGQADRLYYTKGNTPQEMTNTSKIVTKRYATATEKIIVKPRTTPKSAAVTARVRTERDDLKKIEGIGPKISDILNKGGILTFSGLAATPVDRLKRILAEAGNRYKMHNPATWPEQAKLAGEGQWEKLKELQDYLDGGRDTAKG